MRIRSLILYKKFPTSFCVRLFAFAHFLPLFLKIFPRVFSSHVKLSIFLFIALYYSVLFHIFVNSSSSQLSFLQKFFLWVLLLSLLVTPFTFLKYFIYCYILAAIRSLFFHMLHHILSWFRAVFQSFNSGI